MKKAVLLFFLFFPFLIVNGQEPAPPTREWSEWAFRQIPDRDVAKTALHEAKCHIPCLARWGI